MKRLTPQEFFRQHFGWSQDNQININQLSETEHWSLMQAYAEHIEATAWISDGSFPPVDERVFDFSILVISSDNELVMYDFSSLFWRKGNMDRTVVSKWRHFPTLPKQ